MHEYACLPVTGTYTWYHQSWHPNAVSPVSLLFLFVFLFLNTKQLSCDTVFVKMIIHLNKRMTSLSTLLQPPLFPWFDVASPTYPSVTATAGSLGYRRPCDPNHFSFLFNFSIPLLFRWAPRMGKTWNHLLPPPACDRHLSPIPF